MVMLTSVEAKSSNLQSIPVKISSKLTNNKTISRTDENMLSSKYLPFSLNPRIIVHKNI